MLKSPLTRKTFDESKVKRDHGKFAEKEGSAGAPGETSAASTESPKPSEWKPLSSQEAAAKLKDVQKQHPEWSNVMHASIGGQRGWFTQLKDEQGHGVLAVRMSKHAPKENRLAGPSGVDEYTGRAFVYVPDGPHWRLRKNPKSQSGAFEDPAEAVKQAEIIYKVGVDMGKTPTPRAGTALAAVCNRRQNEVDAVREENPGKEVLPSGELIPDGNGLCSRCGGAGNLPQHARVEGGVCFGCDGDGFVPTKKSLRSPLRTKSFDESKHPRDGSPLIRKSFTGIAANGHKYVNGKQVAVGEDARPARHQAAVESLATRAKKLPAAVYEKAKAKVSAVMATWEKRYGPKTARLIAQVGLATFPAPGGLVAPVVLVAAAEVARLFGWHKTLEMSPDELKRLGKQFVADLLRGEKSLRSPLVRKSAEDWHRETGERGGSKWTNVKTGETHYGPDNPGGAARGPGEEAGGAKPVHDEAKLQSYAQQLREKFGPKAGEQLDAMAAKVAGDPAKVAALEAVRGMLEPKAAPLTPEAAVAAIKQADTDSKDYTETTPRTRKMHWTREKTDAVVDSVSHLPDDQLTQVLTEAGVYGSFRRPPKNRKQMLFDLETHLDGGLNGAARNEGTYEGVIPTRQSRFKPARKLNSPIREQAPAKEVVVPDHLQEAVASIKGKDADRDEAQKIVDGLKSHPKDDLRTIANGAGIPAGKSDSPKAILDRVYQHLTGKLRARERVEASLAGGVSKFLRSPLYVTKSADLGDEQERIEAIADILLGIYGDDAIKMLDGQTKGLRSPLVTKKWSEVDHPRGKGGRFIPKGSAEAVSAAKESIKSTLKQPKTPETAKKLVEHLNLLTVKQLHELKKEYKLSASGETREKLIAKLSERLGKGRSGEEEGSHFSAYRQAQERMKTPGRMVGGVRMKQDVISAAAKEWGVDQHEAEAALEKGEKPAVEFPSYKDWAKGEREKNRAKLASPLKATKKPDSVKKNRSLLAEVIHRGGLNLESVKQTYDVKQEFLEHGLGRAFERSLTPGFSKKGKGVGLDQMAEQMEKEGLFQTPKGRNADDYLLELLQNKVKSAHHDYDSQVEREQEAYYKELEDAKRYASQPEIDEAVRAGEEAGRAEGEAWEIGEDAGGMADEEGGDVGDFEFGANAEPEPISHSSIADARRKLASGKLAVQGNATSDPIKSDLSGESIRRHVILPDGRKIHPDELHRVINDDGKAKLGPEKISVKDPTNKGEATHPSFERALNSATAIKGRDSDLVTLQGPHGYSATKTRGEWRDVQHGGGSMAAWYDRENPESVSEAAKNAPAASSMGGEKESASFFSGGQPEQGKLFDYKTPGLQSPFKNSRQLPVDKPAASGKMTSELKIEPKGGGKMEESRGISWTAPAGTPGGIGGVSFTGGRVVTHNGETMVDFGTQNVNGKMQNFKVRVAGKPELAAKVEEAKAAAKAKADRIAAIPGLKELRNAADDSDRYSSDFSRMMNDQDNDGVRPPRGPKTSTSELAAKYPKAAAYLRAESFSRASNDVKATAGLAAMERIENGEDHEAVMEEMENWNHANAYGD